jgi:hypothetical protein
MMAPTQDDWEFLRNVCKLIPRIGRILRLKGNGRSMATLNDLDEPVMTEVLQRIEQAAFGRIRELKVCCERGQVVLDGYARCFHDKQRAQEAALMATSSVSPIANRIKVVCLSSSER